MAPSHKLSCSQCRWYLDWSVMFLSPGVLLCQPVADDLALWYYFQCFSELCQCIDSHADNRPVVWWCHTLLLILHDHDCVLDTCCLQPPHFCYQVIIKCHHQLGMCVVWCLSLSLCIWLPIQTSDIRHMNYINKYIYNWFLQSSFSFSFGRWTKARFVLWHTAKACSATISLHEHITKG